MKLRKPRAGFTLIEVVATTTMVTIVMTSVAVTISSLHRVNSKLRNEYPASAAVSQLALRLRTDAHSALHATLAAADNGESLLRLSLPNARIVEYQSNQERVTRRLLAGELVERREAFTLLRGSTLQWSVAAEPFERIELTIGSHVGKTPGANAGDRSVTIVAAVGLDHSTRP